ncbi:unnamed protein product [Rhodiola kirilowii]
MNQPIGFVDKTSPDSVCLLNKSIYGLKQSPRQWNRKFDACMLSLEFTRSKYDTCMYMKGGKAGCHIFVLLYVDDILLMSHSLTAISEVKGNLKKHFDMKDFVKAQKILGVKIIRNRHDRKISLSQVDYVAKVLDKFCMKESKPSPIPLGGHLEISKDDCPVNETDKQKMSKIPYDMAVGSLMYAMLCTRPDIAFAVSVLSRYRSNPGEKHWFAMKYLLKYIAGTKDLGLVYTDYEKEPELIGYVDPDFASNKDTRKSITSFFFTWGGCCISWKSQQQSIVALSSTEAEYIAATEACKEAIWLQGLLKEMTGKEYVTTLNIDSQSAIYLCKDPVYHERTKHIDVRLHFIRDLVDSKVVIIKKILGDINPADFGTKIVPTSKLVFCRDALHICDVG